MRRVQPKPTGWHSDAIVADLLERPASFVQYIFVLAFLLCLCDLEAHSITDPPQSMQTKLRVSPRSQSHMCGDMFCAIDRVVGAHRAEDSNPVWDDFAELSKHRIGSLTLGSIFALAARPDISTLETLSLLVVRLQSWRTKVLNQ
jgi:hypothetical protein